MTPFRLLSASVVLIGVLVLAASLGDRRDSVTAISPAPLLTSGQPDASKILSDGAGEPLSGDRSAIEVVPEPLQVEDSVEVDPLANTQKDLALYTEASLDGILLLDEVLDQMLALADLDVDSHPDLDYEDDDAIAYKLLGAPEGADVHMLIGMQPYSEGDQDFRYLQLNVDMGEENSEYLRDAMRQGPHVDLSISYDVTNESVPTRFAIQLSRPVSLKASRDIGVNAYHGQYTNGAYYWIDFLNDPNNPTATTVGIIDGQPVSLDKFGMTPLNGDLDLDKDKVAALLRKLQQKLSVVKGKN